MAKKLKIGKVSRTEEQSFPSGVSLRIVFFEGEADGARGEYALRLWSRDGGKTFEGEEEAKPGAEVAGKEPKNERYKTVRGVPAFDWQPQRKGGGGAGAGALARVFAEWFASWILDRKAARQLEWKRFEFERRARVVELTLAAMQQSHKDSVEFDKVREWVESRLG